MHYRAEYRALARAALLADPTFEDYTLLSAWVRDIDPSTLPVLHVATPRETKEQDTHTSSTRVTTLMVIAKIKGGDAIEDKLDELSTVVETVIGTALDSAERACLLGDTEVTVDGGGEKRVGTLIMRFSITFWPAEPLTEA